MKKYIIAAVAALGIAVPIAMPAVAAANSTVEKVFLQRESRVVRNKMSLLGAKFLGLTARCASEGGGRYDCWATYTAYYQGSHVKYGQWATVTGGPYGTITPGRSNLIRAW